MTFPKLIGFFAIVLFGAIAVTALFKGGKQKKEIVMTPVSGPVEVELDFEQIAEAQAPAKPAAPVVQEAASYARSDADLPDANRIQELFNVRGPRLPFIETVVYNSRVDWQKGRPAWLSDYASHYKTSKHFIARSLNGVADYFKQDVANGARFNVFRLDKEVSFYLVIDTSRCKLWFYAYDQTTNERTLLKTYTVGLGRLDSSQISGLLTPLGRYTLGDRVAIYKPKSIGFYNGEKVEMVRIFGTRWIPFDKELEDATDIAQGFGIHGVPLSIDAEGNVKDQESSLGKYESDGCVRLATDDIEELFSIVITKPTTVELVRDFREAHLPGVASN